MNWIRTIHPRPPSDGGVHLWQADYADWAGRLADLKAYLSEDEVNRCDRFLRDGDRDRYAFAHGVLRRVLAGCCGCEPAALAFEMGPHGKPFLAAPPIENKHLEFNLSHSGDLVLIGATSCGPLGVDVERLSRKVEFENLSDRYFSPEEADAIRLHSERGRRRVFFDTWVCKEAFIKAVGDGLTMPLDSFTVRFEGERTMVSASNGEKNSRLGTPWFLDRFRVAPDYVGAVALPIESVIVTGFLLH